MDLKRGAIKGVTLPLASPFPNSRSSHLSFFVFLLFLGGRRLRVRAAGRSGALLADALARAAHFALQLHHLEDGLLAAAAQVVEEAVVLLGETVQHAEHVAWRRRRKRDSESS